MQLKDVLQKTTAYFKGKGIRSARLDTELLLARALNWDRIKIYMNYDYPLTALELDACRALVRRRAQGEPMAYILGSRDFYKSTFVVEPGVLIPRPETETLVEEAVTWLKANASDQPAIIDFGCGSGCIGLSILREIPDANLLACDISAKALEVTMRNAEKLGVLERVFPRAGDVMGLCAADVMEAFEGEADVVVANPPYIAVGDPHVEEGVRKFEPQAALFSGGDGLDHIRAWLSKAAEVVKAGGFVMFEIGAEQGAQASEIFNADGRLEAVSVIKDLAKHDRFVRGLKRGGRKHG